MALCSALEYSCWVISITLIVVLIGMGCMQMRKGQLDDPAVSKGHGPSESRGTCGKSARRAYFKSNTSKVEKLDDGASCAGHDDDVSYGFPSTWQTAEQRASKAQHSPLDDMFTNTDAGDVHVVDKDKAKRASNTLAGFGSESQRSDGVRARTTGLRGLGDLLRPSKPIPIGAKCVSFLDSDSRVIAHDSKSDCLKKGACTFLEDGDHPAWAEL